MKSHQKTLFIYTVSYLYLIKIPEKNKTLLDAAQFSCQLSCDILPSNEKNYLGMSLDVKINVIKAK